MRHSVPLLVLVCCCALFACRQEPRSNQTTTASRTKAQPTATSPAAIKVPPPPIDDSASRMPDGFKPDEIEPLINSLKATGKSEFETTEAFRRRLATEAQTKVYNFVVEPLDTTYDADRQQIRVRLWIKVDPSTTDIEENSMTIPVQNKVERSSFSASNAFGVQVQVQRTTEMAHAIAAVPIPAEMIGKRVDGAMYQFADGQRYQRFLDVRLPLSPDEARVRKDSLRILLRARSSAKTNNRTYYREYEWKATINSPTSRVTQTHAAYVDLSSIQVWLFDVRRGDILAKTTLAELMKPKRAG